MKERLTRQEALFIGQAIVSLVVVLLVAFGAIGGPVIPDAPTARGTTNFTNLDLSGTLTVDGASTLTGALTMTGAIDAASTINAAGTVAAEGAMTVAGTTTLSGLLVLSAADVTIEDSSTLTPTKTVYNMDSAGAVGTTLAASGVEGQLLILVGDDDNAITIADTNIRSSNGGTIAVGQFDVVVFVYIDSEWVELLLIANS